MVCKKSAALAVALTAASLSACDSTSTVKDVTQIGVGESLITTADVRTINRTGGTRDPENGGIRPTSITCAEPSPDVAKAVTEAFNASASLAGKSLEGPSAEAALALSRAQAESIAQLGERLATIQLLRDALYRACEAWANGAISEITYAVMVSRYDDTVITLMTSELAAGAFGRSLAALSGESGGSAKASAALSQKMEERHEAERSLSEVISEKSETEQSAKDKRQEKSEVEESLKQERKQQGAIGDQLAAANTSGGETGDLEERLETSNRRVNNLESESERLDKEISSLESERKESEKRLDEAKQELTAKLEAEADSRAATSAVAAGGITPGQQNPVIAQILHDIQSGYIENINSDALEVACITALSQRRPTPLAGYCMDKLLPALAKNKMEVLRLILSQKRE